MAATTSTPGLLVVPGPRAAEAAVLEEVAARLGPPGTLGALAAPVRVVVPSRVLRDHLAAALVARTRRAVAGVRVQTLMSVAREVLDRARHPTPPGGVLLEVLVRRFARRQPLLHQALVGLEDGFGAVAPAVRDLLDAGLLPEHRDAVMEVLDSAGGNPAWRDRSAAVVEVAAACAGVLRALAGGRREAALSEAAELLALEGSSLLPSRAVLVYGFAETTALAGDLLEALVRHTGASVVLDVPRDPVQPGRVTPGAEYTARLHGRLAGIRGQLSREWEALPEPRVDLVSAAGPDSEVRAVADRIARLLRDGTEPETVAVVARGLEPYLVAIRRHFGRLGIPFSGVSAAAPAAPRGSRREAFLSLLERGGAAPVEIWLEVLASLPGQRLPEIPWELDLGVRALGAAVLEDVAELPARDLAASGGVPLPVRRGLFGADAEEEPDRPETLRRSRLSGATLVAAADAAGELVAALASWPGACPLTIHLSRVGLVLRLLGVGEDDELAQDVADVLDQVAREVPTGFELTRGELVVMLRELAGRAETLPAGGRGGGVRVLSVTEYRGCTAAHLFLLGLNRDVFPRTLTEDPLLPDGVRAAIRPLLPDLAVKAEGHAEERYLFAQALASSPSVTVSWQGRDDNGNGRAPSPLVERLRLERGLAVANAPPWPILSFGEGSMTAAEAAVCGALAANRDAWLARLTAALAEAREIVDGGPETGLVAAARRRVLDELEPDGRSPFGRALMDSLGPYWGFVGAGAVAGREVWVTLLEALSLCPWRAFLERRLGLEPPPLGGGVPGVDALLVGRTVHGVLDRLVTTHREMVGAGDGSVPVPWPSAEALEELVISEARNQAREGGVASLSGLLAIMVRPYLEAARDLEWRAEPPLVAGAEVEGVISFRRRNTTVQDIKFRADRTDTVPSGALVYTDYKTGKPLSPAVKEETRRAHLLAAIRAGERLQAAAYAAAGGVGRYVFLGGLGRDWPQRVFTVDPGDREAGEAFRVAADTLLEAWFQGGLPPRLVDRQDREPPGCSHCGVAEACLRGDTGARSRFLAWARKGGSGSTEPAGDREEAARRIWAIREPPGRQERGEGGP